MSDLYLIAHRVRGEPAFDVAQRMECPHCGNMGALYKLTWQHECEMCDGEGYWWIIPTSGHRAYPYWFQAIDDLISWVDQAPYGGADVHMLMDDVPPMPEGWPDHYPCNRTADPSLTAVLAALSPPQSVRRRV